MYGHNATTVDYTLVKKKAESSVRDAKAISVEECLPQHWLLA